MSEKLNQPSPEHTPSARESANKNRERLKELQQKAERATEPNEDAIEAIKKSIEAEAVSGKEFTPAEKESPSPNTFAINKELKSAAFKKSIRRTQAQLSAPERSFSKVIHAPAVERASDIAAKTVARPTGILAGGIGALAGTVFLLYISKQSGFHYNYSVLLLLFLASYCIGIVIELLVKLIFKK